MLDTLIVDSFAGGGGASLGIELAMGRSPHIAINHDQAAIEMHAANHPDTFHYTENVWHVNPRDACSGRPVRLFWASPDCKHFSRAKGGKPVNKNIRGLAWVVVKWARQVEPATIFLENVREFQDWGPLTKLYKGGRLQYEKDGVTPKLVPVANRKGATFRRWVRELEGLGYAVEWRVLNAADYGVPTDRRRLFVIARRDGQPICWPAPTHTKPDKSGKVPAGLLPWRTAAECIDWEEMCPSIFLSREEATDLFKVHGIRCKRPLKEKTMWRMANGLKRYVIESSKPFLVRTGHFSPASGEGGTFRGQGVDEPLATVCGTNDKGIVAPVLTKYYSQGGQDQPVDDPLHTVVGKARFAVTPAYLIKANHGVDHMRGQPINQPLHTITASRGAGVVAPVIAKLRGDSAGSAVGEPLPTITSGAGSVRPAGAAHAMGVVAAHVTKFFGGVVGTTVEQPLPTVTAIDHSGLVAAVLTKFYGTNRVGADILAALPTVTADGKHLGVVHAELAAHVDEETLAGFWRVYAFLVKYLGKDAPLPIVRAEGQVYLIVDVGMRMLKPRELLNAQFTPELAANYKLTGSNANQVAKIGNSVPPLLAKVIVEHNLGKRGAKVA